MSPNELLETVTILKWITQPPLRTAMMSRRRDQGQYLYGCHCYPLIQTKLLSKRKNHIKHSAQILNKYLLDARDEAQGRNEGKIQLHKKKRKTKQRNIALIGVFKSRFLRFYSNPLNCDKNLSNNKKYINRKQKLLPASLTF